VTTSGSGRVWLGTEAQAYGAGVNDERGRLQGKLAEALDQADSAEARVAELDERWQALKDWLASEITHDCSVMESFADYPDGGVTSKAHGALASAKRAVLARMRELER
jgi:hypothetical protein